MSAKRQPLRAHEARQRMWNSLRQLRVFTSADVEATAEASARHVRKYFRGLQVAGYLVESGKRASGSCKPFTEYRLVRNTGPLAPRLSATGVFDPNLADPLLADAQRLKKHAPAFYAALRGVVSADATGAGPALRQALQVCVTALQGFDGVRA